MRIVSLVLNDVTRDARVMRHAAALASQGHEVTVLGLRSPGALGLEERNGYRIRRVADYTTADHKQPLAKLKQARVRSARLLLAAVASAPDVVHCNDLDTLAVGVRAAASTGCLVLYDAHELYVDMLVANRARVSTALSMYWRVQERRLVRRVDAFVTVGEAVAHEFQKRLGEVPKVILNVPSLAPLTCADRAGSRLRRHLALPRTAVLLLYQGLVGRNRGLETVIETLPRVDGVVLAIQGHGDRVGALEQLAYRAGVAHRVHFLAPAPVTELHSWAEGADVGHALFTGVSLNTVLATPNKLFQYMMAGTCVLASDFPGMRPIVTAGPCGLLCKPDSLDDVAGALSRLASDPGLRQRMGAAGRALAEQHYNWERESQKLVALYEQLQASLPLRRGAKA